MAGVFQELEIEWKGKTYRVKPTMQLINRIEQDVSLSRLAQRMYKGDVPASHIATVVGHLLRSAGVDVKDEELYLEMMTGNNPDVISGMCAAVVVAAFPSPPGNVDAPAKPTKQK